jgi:hypothetical protein
MEAALRQLDERCRLYQYLIKRTVDPFVAPLCAEPVAQEALCRRTAYLNDRRPELYQLAQYVVLLREAGTQGQVSTRLHGIWQEPRESLRRWLDPRHWADTLGHRAPLIGFQEYGDPVRRLE